MKRILVLGATGLLGRYLMNEGARRGHMMVGTWHTRNPYGFTVQIDITNRKSVDRAMSLVHPDVVIHAAGNNSVDWCEKNKGEAWQMARDSTQCIVDCEAKLFYISTNAVYLGDSPPYDFDSLQAPINVYGKCKGAAEFLYRHRRTPENTCVVRPILLYGWPPYGARRNWMTRIISAPKPLHLVTDRVTQPLYAGDAARAILTLVDEDATECYNIGGGDVMSLYDFGQTVCKEYGYKSSTILPTTTKELEKTYPDMAPRPVNTTFSMKRWLMDHEPIPGVVLGLERMWREETDSSNVYPGQF